MNPLLIRHLYGSARRNRFFILLTLYLLAVGLITTLFVTLILSDWVTGMNRVSMQEIFSGGRALYWFSSVILLISAILLAPINALGAFSSEREHRTLDLLRVTTLTPRALVLGKMTAACLSGGLYLLAPLPLLMFGYWLGGVTTTELILTLLFLTVTLLNSIAWGLFVSSLTRKTIAAVLIFYGISLAIAPFTGLLLTLLSTFVYSISVIPLQPVWIEVLLQHGWVLLTALHPLAAAIATEGIWVDQGSWFVGTFELERYIAAQKMPVNLGNVTLPSPWIPHLCLSLLTTGLLVWQTIRRMRRPEN